MAAYREWYPTLDLPGLGTNLLQNPQATVGLQNHHQAVKLVIDYGKSVQRDGAPDPPPSHAQPSSSSSEEDPVKRPVETARSRGPQALDGGEEEEKEEESIMRACKRDLDHLQSRRDQLQQQRTDALQNLERGKQILSDRKKSLKTLDTAERAYLALSAEDKVRGVGQAPPRKLDMLRLQSNIIDLEASIKTLDKKLHVAGDELQKVQSEIGDTSERYEMARVELERRRPEKISLQEKKEKLN